MKKLNVIIVYNKEENKILMCKREKEPYKGKFNLVGGKVEQNEDELHAAYRELQEETGITDKDITLTHIMNFQYKIPAILACWGHIWGHACPQALSPLR